MFTRCSYNELRHLAAVLGRSPQLGLIFDPHADVVFANMSARCRFDARLCRPCASFPPSDVARMFCGLATSTTGWQEIRFVPDGRGTQLLVRLTVQDCSPPGFEGSYVLVLGDDLTRMAPGAHCTT